MTRAGQFAIAPKRDRGRLYVVRRVCWRRATAEGALLGERPLALFGTARLSWTRPPRRFASLALLRSATQSPGEAPGQPLVGRRTAIPAPARLPRTGGCPGVGDRPARRRARSTSTRW